MTPRTEALAFRIWAIAKPKDWDCTLQELSDATGESVMRVSAICRQKNWNRRLRSSSSYYLDTGHGIPQVRLDEVSTLVDALP
jgi:hypothetical protein